MKKRLDTKTNPVKTATTTTNMMGITMPYAFTSVWEGRVS